MKQYEKAKKEISECDSAMEIVGYLEGLKSAAVVYCSITCPDEIWNNKGGGAEISLYGLECFFEHEVNDT